MKQCPKCGEVNQDAFYATSTTKFCKKCHSADGCARQKQRRRDDPSYRIQRAAYAKTYRKPVIGDGHCLECASVFEINYPYQVGRKKFCSRSCKGKWSGRTNVETVKALRAACMLPEVKAKQLASILRGPDHPLWIDGRSAVQRPRAQSAQWRKAVFERDDYTCQMCYRRGGRLQADHIRPYASNPDVRWDLSNGRTLCFECHKLTPTYGGKLSAQLRRDTMLTGRL